jgi:hypothetical protein
MHGSGDTQKKEKKNADEIEVVYLQCSNS